MLKQLSFMGFCFASLLLVSCRSSETVLSDVPKEYPPSQETMHTMERIANWQLPRLLKAPYAGRARNTSQDPKQWIQGAFYTGLTRLAERSDNPTYEKWIGMIGRKEDWRLGKRTFHADDHIIAQTYLWYYLNAKGTPEMLAHTIETFDAILEQSPDVSLEFIPVQPKSSKSLCQTRWCWADALYMSPPAWFALSKATGDEKYAQYAHKEFKATMDYLYSDEYKLMYRDSRYHNSKGAFGEPIFWSRGMGWVIAGFANSMEEMDKNDPNRAYYEKYFIEMAKGLMALQKENGTWSMSLLAKEKMKNPETSGTAFFTYAFAWGIKNGLLSKEEFWPSTARGWKALNDAIHPDGKLGWVQRVGDKPGDASFDDTQMYASGAFLLAGAMIYDLAKANEDNQ